MWANCGRDRGSVPRIPTEIPAGLDAAATPQARADRAYQIATATFYAGQWDAAVSRFRAIAADRTSPWQPWGEYLAGRAFLRKGTIGGAGGALDQAALADAAAAFAKVAADPASPLRESAAGLVRFIDLRRRPDALRLEVAAKLLAPDAGASFSDDLDEYRYLFLRSEPAADAPLESGRGAAPRDPLTDWIDTLRSESPDALDHAIARWKAQTAASQRMPWLVAAMLRLTPGHADEAALVAAARAVPASSPAYPSLAFQRARLLIREGKLDEARALAAEMAEASAAWPPSAVNQLRAVQLRLATSFDGFLAAAIAPAGGVRVRRRRGPRAEPGGPGAEQRRARHRQRTAAAVAADRRCGEHGMARAPARRSPSGGADARVAPRRQGCGAPCRCRRPQVVSGPRSGSRRGDWPRRRGRSAASWSRCCSPAVPACGRS